MTTSPGRITPWISVPAALLVWIVLLSLNLRAMLGAGMSGGWVIAGIMFTFSGIFILWMLSEIVSAVHTQVVAHESLRGVKHEPRQRQCPQELAASLSGKDRFDITFSNRQRETLGLNPHHTRPNRMRKGR